MTTIYSESYPWEIDARFDQDYLYILDSYYELNNNQHVLQFIRIYNHLKDTTFPKDDERIYTNG